MTGNICIFEKDEHGRGGVLTVYALEDKEWHEVTDKMNACNAEAELERVIQQNIDPTDKVGEIWVDILCTCGRLPQPIGQGK